MKDLSEFYKGNYSFVFSRYEKDVKEDLKRIKNNGNIYKGYLTMPLFLLIYVPLALFFNISITSIISWSCYLIASSISVGCRISTTRRRLLSSSIGHMKELTTLLFRNDIDVSVEDLKDAIITEKKSKNKVEYRVLGDKKKTINHTSEVFERLILFKDREEQVQCLKEIKEIIKQTGKPKEQTRKAYLLEPEDFETENIGEAKIMKLKKGN